MNSINHWLNTLHFFLIRLLRLVKHYSTQILLRILFFLSLLVFFSAVTYVSGEEIQKLSLNLSWPTFRVTECLDILLLSITKLVNCFLLKGFVSRRQLLPYQSKRLYLRCDNMNYRPVSGLCFISKMVQ